MKGLQPEEVKDIANKSKLWQETLTENIKFPEQMGKSLSNFKRETIVENSANDGNICDFEEYNERKGWSDGDAKENKHIAHKKNNFFVENEQKL